MEIIKTRRLELRSASREALIADLEGSEALSKQLRVQVPDNWPPLLYDEPAIQWAIDRLTAGEPEKFLLYYWIIDAETDPALIGLGGYKGAPSDGVVEIGYSVLEQYHRQGVATEAVRALLEFAFQQPDIREVIAETLPELVASIGVLEKNNFRLIGPGSEDGVIRFALTRDEWRLAH